MTSINKFLLSIIIFIFFFSLILYLSNNFFPLDRHWSSFYDHELTLTYNALLFNSAELHEYVDHSGYFTILFLSIFLKILNFFGYLAIYKITLLNESNNLNVDLQNIIYFTRIYTMICTSFLCLVIYWIFEFFSKNRFFSFLLTFLLFLSIGTFEHFIQLRTELLTMIFFILSFLSIVVFLTEKKNFELKYLFLFFIFLFSAILNKTQIFFYLFAILLVASFIKVEKTKYFNFENYKFLENKNFTYYLLGIVILYLILKLITKGSSISGISFIFVNILMINTFFYLVLKKIDLDIKKNLKFINLVILACFVVFKAILFIHPSTNEMAFNNTFTNVIDNTFKYTITSTEGNSGIISILIDFIIRFIDHLIFLFRNINYYSFLIIGSLLLNFTLKKNTKIIYFNLSCIFSFLIISYISSLRGPVGSIIFAGFPYYNIFSDFFLILSFVNYSKHLKNRVYLVILPIIIIAGLLNYHIIYKYRIGSISHNRIEEICDNSYFYDWHKKIPANRFKSFCNSAL